MTNNDEAQIIPYDSNDDSLRCATVAEEWQKRSEEVARMQEYIEEIEYYLVKIKKLVGDKWI